jgi:hypothetical protein
MSAAGRLTFEVDGPDGRAIPGGTITVENATHYLASGQTMIAGLTPGEHTFVFQAQGYRTRTLPFTVTQDLQKFHVQLQPITGELVLEVYDLLGQPIQGASVTIEGRTYTLRTGLARLAGVTTGTQVVVFEANGYRPQTRALRVVEGSQRVEVRLQRQ